MRELKDMDVRELRLLRDAVDKTLEAKAAAKDPGEEDTCPSRSGGGRRSGGGTLRREKVGCGKQACKKCADGPSHGPYWYLYYYRNGKLASKYLGKNLPDGFEHPHRPEAGGGARSEQGDARAGRGRARPVPTDRRLLDPPQDDIPTLF